MLISCQYYLTHGIVELMKGFTLVELLIAITIIVILSAIGMLSYNGIQAVGRDSRRQEDVRALTTAVELYRQATGAYPPTGCVASPGVSGALVPASGNSYINRIPRDPSCQGTINMTTCSCAQGDDYVYGIQNGRPYFLAATENVDDLTTTCASLGLPSIPADYRYCYAP